MIEPPEINERGGVIRHSPLDRRTALRAGLGLGVLVVAQGEAQAEPLSLSKIVSEEHWVKKGDVSLFVYRKRLAHRAEGGAPVLFLVHGSSFSGRGGFDLQVTGYSIMDRFARGGFDVWTMDHENYGRSSKTAGKSDIESGAADLAAAFPLVERLTGRRALIVYGQSGGALRAGLYAMQAPDRIDRLILDGVTYTGNGAPEILRRRANIEALRSNRTRPATPQTYLDIFTRDDPTTFDPAVPRALADYELRLVDAIPNGTYFDMASKLPILDPGRLTMPVQILRAAFDGNATDADVLDFFAGLPNRDKQLIATDGVSHVAVLGTARERVLHSMEAFMTLPGLTKNKAA